MKTAKKLKRKEDREGRKGRRDRPSSSFSTSSHHNKHRDGRPPHHQPHRQQAVCKRTDLSSSSSSSSSSSLPSKKKKKGGGSGAGSSFRVLGLSSYTSHAAVKKLGYTQPTPIQRRSIPILLKGRDCIIKSRTGSGKTCAYLLPLVDLLQSHSSIVGVRGLIIVPTRELVYQISSLVSRLFRDTSLRYASLIGGLNLEKQFQALSNNPDVIIATVGRITQLVQEKVLSLKAVQYLVLDEADRMFELGWGTDELRVIWNNISSSSSFSSRAVSSSSSVNERSQKDLTGGRDRGGGGEEDFFVLRGRCQAIIVSATLPSRLAEFSRLGLNNPELVQLDKELTLSQHLELRFLFVRTSQKIPCLLFLLSQHANKGDQVIVFVSSRHQANFLNCFARKLDLPSAVIYGSMDQEERLQSLAAFKKKKMLILLVTDVASRGLDIPYLPSVINFDFPSSPKLFVHRVGRTARAGRPGVGISLVTIEDLPYAIELMSFLGGHLSPLSSSSSAVSKPEHPHSSSSSVSSSSSSISSLHPLSPPTSTPNVNSGEEEHPPSSSSVKRDVYFLGGPPESIDYFVEFCENLVQHDEETATSGRSASAATKMYYKMRQSASRKSVERAKELLKDYGGISRLTLLPHPAYDISASSSSSSSLLVHRGEKEEEEQEEKEGKDGGEEEKKESVSWILKDDKNEGGHREQEENRDGLAGTESLLKNTNDRHASSCDMPTTTSSSSSPSSCSEKSLLRGRDEEKKAFSSSIPSEETRGRDEEDVVSQNERGSCISSKDILISRLQAFRPKVGMMGAALSASTMLAMKRKREELQFYQSLRSSHLTSGGLEEEEDDVFNSTDKKDEKEEEKPSGDRGQLWNGASLDEGKGAGKEGEKSCDRAKEDDRIDVVIHVNKKKKRSTNSQEAQQQEEEEEREDEEVGEEKMTDSSDADEEEKEEKGETSDRQKTVYISKRRRRRMAKEGGVTPHTGDLSSFLHKKNLSFPEDQDTDDNDELDTMEKSFAFEKRKMKKRKEFQACGGFYLDVTSARSEKTQKDVLEGAVLDLLGDEDEDLKRQKYLEKQRWDPKKRKYILMKVDSTTGHAVKRKRGSDKQEEKTSSAHRYALWCKKTKRRIQRVGEEEDQGLLSAGRCRYTRGGNESHVSDDGEDSGDDEKNPSGRREIQAKNFLSFTDKHKGIQEALKKGMKLTHKQKRIVKKLQAGVYSSQQASPGGRGGKGTRSGDIRAGSLPTVDQIAKKRRRDQQIRLRQDKKKSREEARKSKEKWMRRQQSKAMHRGAKNRSLMIVKKPSQGKASRRGKKKFSSASGMKQKRR